MCPLESKVSIFLLHETHRTGAASIEQKCFHREGKNWHKRIFICIGKYFHVNFRQINAHGTFSQLKGIFSILKNRNNELT